MTIIKCLSELIDEELGDAEKYVDLAIKWKEDEPDTADLFLDLSKEEMGHVDKLHENVAKLIEDYREEHGEPPKDMLTLYDYLHEKHIKKAMHIRVKQGMYNA